MQIMARTLFSTARTGLARPGRIGNSQDSNDRKCGLRDSVLLRKLVGIDKNEGHNYHFALHFIANRPSTPS
jgi:hypothetical protein